MNRSEILDAARECVCGQREQDYGSPEDSFMKIAALWTAYLAQKITPKDVAVMMALLKIARISAGHGKTDNWVDLAGYAACGGEIESAVEERRAMLDSKEAEPQMITMRELVRKYFPDYVKDDYAGGVMYCPGMYGLDNPAHPIEETCHFDLCEECWSQMVDTETEIHEPRC